jgi:hypothetical protein
LVLPLWLGLSWLEIGNCGLIKDVRVHMDCRCCYCTSLALISTAVWNCLEDFGVSASLNIAEASS